MLKARLFFLRSALTGGPCRTLPGRKEPAAPRPGRRTWLRLGLALSALGLFLLADYALYLHLPPGGRSLNRGENGLWLRYRWYFGQRSDAEIAALARRLEADQIRFAYFHVRHVGADGALRYRSPHSALRLTQGLRREAPGVKAIAWVYAGNNGGGGLPVVALSRPEVRRRMVSEARWLVEACGFDGIQWDYEICPDRDPHFLGLMRETRAALPRGKILAAAVPMWLPPPFGRWGWSEGYFARVAGTADQMAVMAYDSALYLPRAYAWLLHQQVARVPRAAARGNAACHVLLGLPTYGRGGASHHAPAENLFVALRGVRDGCADPEVDTRAFAGVALFADYTTQPEEWQAYRCWWLNRSPGGN